MSEKEMHETKIKILKTAEKLFAESGFHATSVDKIAKTAGLTKSNIYYHFKDKEEIISSLMANLIKETEENINKPSSNEESGNIIDEIASEIKFLSKKKKILTVMFMEALKRGDVDDTLFKCAEMVINHEHSLIYSQEDNSENKLDFLTYEFFTGFLPLLSFVIFQDSFSKYFKCDKKQLLDLFLKSFMQTHFNNHPQPENKE